MSNKEIFLRKGLIYNVNGDYDWMFSHAQVPFGYLLDEKTLRIYYATRDNDNRCIATFIEVDPKNPSEIKYVHNQFLYLMFFEFLYESF